MSKSTSEQPARGSDEEIRRYVMVKTPLEPADLAFVFGTRHGIPNFADKIADYWQKHFFPWIVIAGGPTKGETEPESDALKNALVSRHVPPDRIICERRSTNTGENVEFSLPIIEQHFGIQHIRSLIAVGKISSSRRYLMTLERHWPGPKKMILPINSSQYQQLDDSMETKHRLAKLMCLCVDLDSVSAAKSIRAADGIPSHSARLETVSKLRKTAKAHGYRNEGMPVR